MQRRKNEVSTRDEEELLSSSVSFWAPRALTVFPHGHNTLGRPQLAIQPHERDRYRTLSFYLLPPDVPTVSVGPWPLMAVPRAAFTPFPYFTYSWPETFLPSWRLLYTILFFGIQSSSRD